jgi:hypothetical protein
MRFTSKLLCILLFTVLLGTVVYTYMPVQEGWVGNRGSEGTVLYMIMGVTLLMFLTFIVAGLGDYYNRTLPTYNRPILAPAPMQGGPSARRGGARK